MAAQVTLPSCASATPCPIGKDFAYCMSGPNAGGCSPWATSGPFKLASCPSQCVSPATGPSSTGSGKVYTFDTFSCQTGDCNGKKTCTVSGDAPSTLFEWTFTPDGTDIYDISAVDGYNVGIAAAPAPGTFSQRPGQDCGAPSCTMDTSRCPPELQMKIPGAGNATACLSICAAVSSLSQRAQFPVLQAMYTATVPNSGGKLMRDLVCCSCGDGCSGKCGCDDAACAYGCSPYVSTYPPSYSSRTCKVESWPQASNGESYITTFQRQCPSAYSWQFDDAKSLRYCTRADYDITLCG